MKRNLARWLDRLAAKWGRTPSLTVFPDDVFLASYPRSGNTYLRFLVGTLIQPDNPVTFANIERRIPDIHKNSDSEMRGIKRPRILKSHLPYDERYPRVIYAVRDPRDVAVSYYYYLVKIGRFEERFPWSDFVSAFVAGRWPVNPRFGSWESNVSSWLDSGLGASRFHRLRYEDLKADPRKELAKIASFLGVSASEADLDKAVELSSRRRMRNLEKEQSHLWRPTRNTRDDVPFVRDSAKTWRELLPRESVDLIEGKWANLMIRLGYTS